jgi:hypothetical protein
MSIATRVVAAFAVASFSALPAAAQNPYAEMYPMGCALLPNNQLVRDAPQIIGIQDPVPKTLYGPRDLLIINGGTSHNIQVGQRFYVRRYKPAGYREGGDRPILTSGGLRIIAANEGISIGQVELGCDGIHPGDYLEEAPQSAPLDNRAGESDLDFSSPLRVLYGDNARVNGGKGDLMLAELGEGAQPGTRYAVYRDLKVDGVPLAPVGEAEVVSISESTALVRLTMTKDSVKSGDLLIPHRR